MDTPLPKNRTQNGSNRMGMMLIIFLVLIVVVGGFFYMQSGGFQKTTFNKDAYHAVFMSNGQVYFGKIDKMTDQFATVTDIYYLQRLAAPIQPIEPSDDGATADPLSDIQLVKLGGEIHGPTDRMDINRDHLLFIEELRSDSRIVTTIQEQGGE